MQTEKTGHLAWCALVALALARRDGRVPSPALENLFLTRWLATALRQRRFSRDVAPDIEWLLAEGRRSGVGAGLADRLNALWRACTGELSGQSDLFRLTYALETARNMRRSYRLLSDREWSGRYAVALDAGVDGVYLPRTGLERAFDDDGLQIRPLQARLTGDAAGTIALLSRCGWRAEPEPEGDAARPRGYTLMAGQGGQ